MSGTNEQNKKEKYINFLQKHGLLIGSFSLVVILLFVFKNQDLVKVYESSRKNVKTFYAENFKPLFTKTTLTNEDIFNFALYKNVPLNKQEKSILQIAEDEGEKFSYEVYPDVYQDNTDNYEKFNNYFKLTNSEQKPLDSIFSIYKDKLDRSILLSENQQFAFNTNLNLLHDALFVDMLTYLNKVRPQEVSNFFNTTYFADNIPVAENLVKKADVDTSNDYIVFLDDSVFTKRLELIPNPEVPRPDPHLGINLRQDPRSFDFRISARIPTTRDEIAWYRINPEYSKVVIQKEKAEKLEEAEKLRECISNASQKIRNLEFHIQVGEDKHGDFSFVTEYIDSGQVHSFQFNAGDIQKIIETSLSGLDFSDVKSWEDYGARWEQYGLRIDSLATVFEKTYQDSIESNLENLALDLKKLKQELEAKKREKRKQRSERSH